MIRNRFKILETIIYKNIDGYRQGTGMIWRILRPLLIHEIVIMFSTNSNIYSLPYTFN